MGQRLGTCLAFTFGFCAVACGSSQEDGLFRDGSGGSPGGSTAAGAQGSGDVGHAGGGGAGAEGGVPSGGSGTATGGTATGGTATGGDGGTAPVGSCDSDLDCTPRGQLCDFGRGVCADCTLDAQCDAGFGCRGGECVEVVACTDSLDCAYAPGGRGICDPGAGECVMCLRPADCGAEFECVGNSCVAGAGCVPEVCGARCGSWPDGCDGQLDCGPCANAHCGNGIQDGDETGQDCGGVDCPACVAGAWERCLVDTDCADGRVCSKATQEVTAPGRWGFCTRPCSTSADCTDPAAPGGDAPYCFGAGYYCLLECGTSGICPATMECVAGVFLSAACRHALMP